MDQSRRTFLGLGAGLMAAAGLSACGSGSSTGDGGPVTLTRCSVDLNLRTVGRRAAELLVRMIAGDAGPGGIEYVDCTLVARQSA